MRTAAIPSSLRKINRRLILRHMVQVKTAARGELAKVAGTSCVTAGKIVDELLEQGVLEPAESKRISARPGRPGQNLRLNAREPRFLLVQVGVAHTRVAYAALGTSLDTPWAVEIDTPPSAREWEQALRKAVESITPPDTNGLWGALVSVPGIVNERESTVVFSPNLHWSEGVDFRRIIRSLVNVPVEMVQEIRALALGQLGSSPGLKDFLLVDFGHGVGGAAVLGGGLFSGPLPLIGELGHSPLIGNERLCGCGSIGCIETLLSRRGLFASIREQSGETSPDGKYNWQFVEHYIHEKGLEPWLKHSLQAGAASVAGALNVLGLGRVVITGSLNSLSDEVKEYFATQIRKGAMWGRFGEVQIEFAPRRRMRGMISVGIDRLVVGA